MADIEYCEACAELKKQDPNLIANGFSDENCENMMENKGLTGRNDDCTDLNDMNDCLIGSMADEAEISDVCDWREYMMKFVPNQWTVTKAIICAVCGLWNKVTNFMDIIRSFRLTKTGSTISLDSVLGNHGKVTDSNTTYDLVRNGNTVVLEGSDGTTDSVDIANTKYKLTKNGNNILLQGSDGITDSVTDSNTTYVLSKAGDTISLNGSDGSRNDVIDNNTTYSLSREGDSIKLTGSDGSEDEVPAGGGASFGVSFANNSYGKTVSLDASSTNTMVLEVRRVKIASNKTVGAGKTTRIEYAANSLYNAGYRLIGIAGYNFNDTYTDKYQGVANFNVIAVEAKTDMKTVYVQVRNEKNETVHFDLFVTMLLAKA